MGFKAKAALHGITGINCCYSYNRYFFVLTVVFYSPSLYVITDNVDILHLVHMFACYFKEDFEFCMLTFQFKVIIIIYHHGYPPVTADRPMLVSWIFQLMDS